MKRGENLQQAAVPLNNYQFDFGLPGMPKPSGSLKDQKAQPLKSTPQASSAGWSASPGGWGSSQSASSDQAFDFFGRSNAGGGAPSNPNVAAQPRPQMGGSVSSTYDFLGKPNPLGSGSSYYGGARPQVGNVGGMNSFSKGGVGDLSGKSWSSQSTTASKLASAGIPGYKPSSKEDVFMDLLGGALGGKSSAPLKQQQAAASAGAYGMGNLQSAMPEVSKAPVHDTKPAKPAPFMYTNMFKSPTPPAQKPAPKPAQTRGGDPFADISFSKPSNGQSSDPFDFGVKKQTAPPAPAAARMPTSDPFAGSAGGDQFDSMFGAGISSSRAPAAKTPLAHDGWGEAFGAAAESHSFENEGVTTELEGVGSAPAGLTGNSAFQKGSSFYKDGQFPNAIKWFSWSVELMEKEKGSKDAIIEVLTKRISCFKEIGEMKKAIADCSKVCLFLP